MDSFPEIISQVSVSHIQGELHVRRDSGSRMAVPRIERRRAVVGLWIDV
jgi:hypothetical protein